MHDFAAPVRGFGSRGPAARVSVGKVLRRSCRALRSPHAAFAIRCALAVLCSQIPAYLKQTQQWYNEQRVLWTSITVSQPSPDSETLRRTYDRPQIAIVTNRSVGQGVFAVLCQIAGVVAGCLLSLIAWYIVE